MSEQNESKCETGLGWSRCDSFRLFEGLTSAQSIGKLSVALLGLAAVFLAGWLFDWLALAGGSDYRVFSLADSRDATRNLSEIDLYVADEKHSADSVKALRDGVIQNQRKQLLDVLTRKPFELTMEKARAALDGQTVTALVAGKKTLVNTAVERLRVRYQAQYDRWRKKRAASAGDAAVLNALNGERQRLETAYRDLVQAVVGATTAEWEDYNKWIGVLVSFDIKAKDKATEKKAFDSDTKVLTEAYAVGRARYLLAQADGRGVFASWVDFKCRRIYQMAMGLITLNCQALRQAGYELLMGMCWLSRFHPFYLLGLTLVGLAVWSVTGTAICRVTALQVARGERIGPVRSLRFGLSKWFSAFMAPVIPGLIIVGCAMLIWVGALVFAWIPGLGAVIGALLLGFAVLIGLLIAFLSISTAAGSCLMFPAIAVEGSGSFDAISRAISYLREKPWWFLLYYGVTAVYSLVCYVFIRFFIFIALLSVNVAAGLAVNAVSSASRLSNMGKMAVIWPTPAFDRLTPAVNWAMLSGTEAVAAALVWLVVTVTVGYLAAWAVSLYFSTSTVIYMLLRKKVDAIAMDDVWTEEDAEALVNEGIEYLDEEAPAAGSPSADSAGGPAGTPHDANDGPGDDDQSIPLEPEDPKET